MPIGSNHSAIAAVGGGDSLIVARAAPPWPFGIAYERGVEVWFAALPDSIRYP